ncbi:MAG: helix-turn-helix transcriptional regulator [Candidatus Hadarchaeia archaeon]
MELKGLVSFMVLVVAIQIVWGIIFFLFLRGTPGIDLFSIGLGILALVVVSTVIGTFLYWLAQRYMKERAIKTAMMAMSDDEQKVLREVIQRGEVRQDELRKDVSFSKSKLSALLNNLKEKNAIKKSRYKRTNKITPTEEFSR